MEAGNERPVPENKFGEIFLGRQEFREEGTETFVNNSEKQSSDPNDE